MGPGVFLYKCLDCFVCIYQYHCEKRIGYKIGQAFADGVCVVAAQGCHQQHGPAISDKDFERIFPTEGHDFGIQYLGRQHANQSDNGRAETAGSPIVERVRVAEQRHKPQHRNGSNRNKVEKQFVGVVVNGLIDIDAQQEDVEPSNENIVIPIQLGLVNDEKRQSDRQQEKYPFVFLCEGV